MKSKTQHKFAYRISAVLLSLTIAGCDSDSDKSVSSLPDTFQGVWEREGYGQAYIINQSGGEFYEFTSNTCLLVDKADNDDIAEFFQYADLTDDDSQMVLNQKKEAFFPILLNKRDTLPDACLSQGLIKETSPTQVFSHFVETFSDYYAFFDERNINWNALVAEAQMQINDGMSDDELFELLSNLIEPLDDGHVQLEGNGQLFRPAKERGANRLVLEAFNHQNEFTDVQAFANNINQQYWQNLSSYLDEDSIEVFDGALPVRLIWATMGEGSVGYLYIASMAYLSEQNDGLDTDSNVAVIKELMNRVMIDLGTTQALVIDVRNNIGGHDEVSREIANHFTDQERKVISKFARSSLGDSTTVQGHIRPASETPYLNPVALIAGVETASAAEAFVLSMTALPQVTLVGEHTNGILSDVLERELPNGWEFWLANEVYLDYQGNSHEVIGIPAEVEAPVFSLEAIEAGNNPALDAALEALGYSN